MNLYLGLALSVVLAVATASAMAEDQALTISPEARIGLLPLLDQTLTQSGTITVKPVDLGSPQGALSQPLPEHCLMSVTVTFTDGDVALQPGKMVCVNDDHMPLEGLANAKIEALGTCQFETCNRYIIRRDNKGSLKLRSELRLGPQPRNENN